MPEDKEKAIENFSKEILKVDMGAEGVKSVSVAFPSNSHKSREERTTPAPREDGKRVKGPVVDKVIIKKKTLGDRFKDAFTGEDFENITSYIVHDVLIAAAKGVVFDIIKTATDAVKDSIETALWGGPRRDDRVRREGGKSYIRYDKQFNKRDDRDSRDSRDSRDNRDRREFTDRDRARHNFGNLIIPTRGKAEEVLSELVDLTFDYGHARVADLYDLLDMTGNYTDNDYGWKNLSTAQIIPVRGGYKLDLPRPRLLD